MIVLAGGGTGGHLSIIKALQVQLLQRGISPLYIGSTRGQDREWFGEDRGFIATYFLPSRGFTKGIGNKLKALYFLIKAISQSIAILRKHRIKQVISVGGFSAAPCALSAILLRIPLYIHEQNAILGRLNRLCVPFAKQIFCSFNIDHRLVQLTSYPIDQIFFDKARIRERLQTIIFLGGSGGAAFINEIALALSPYLKAMGIHIIHQTGRKDVDQINQAYTDSGIAADVFPFTSSLYDKIAQADFAISRAGATTMWELVSNGVPTLFIPYPYAIHNHQYHNARFLYDKKLCFLMPQSECKEEQLITRIKELSNAYKISEMSAALLSINSPYGVANIIDMVLNE